MGGGEHLMRELRGVEEAGSEGGDLPDDGHESGRGGQLPREVHEWPRECDGVNVREDVRGAVWSEDRSEEESMEQRHFAGAEIHRQL